MRGCNIVMFCGLHYHIVKIVIQNFPRCRRSREGGREREKRVGREVRRNGGEYSDQDPLRCSIHRDTFSGTPP